MLGWIKAALKVAAGFVGLLKKGSTPTVAELLPHVIGQLLPAVESAIKYRGLSSKEQLDSWLLELDVATGSDTGALDVIKSLPPDQEEALFDHLVEVARIYGYHLLKLPGYTV